MFQLIYISKAYANITNEDISEIVKVAQQFNSDNNVTGCLLCFNKQFIQFLEGDKEVVERLFEKIKMDNRHSKVQKILSINSKNRAFTQWSMAYRQLENQDLYNLRKEIFADNVLNFSDLVGQSIDSIQLFWKNIKNALMKDQ